MHSQVEGNLNTLIGLINSTTKLENEAQRNHISLTFLSYYLFLMSKINRSLVVTFKYNILVIFVIGVDRIRDIRCLEKGN